MRDVRMVQGRKDLGLALEPGKAFRVSREGVRQVLQGIIASEPDVPCPPHLAHPALTNQGSDLIRAEARTGSHLHGGRSEPT